MVAEKLHDQNNNQPKYPFKVGASTNQSILKKVLAKEGVC
jgi:hypothetical protein